jgi:hypothetical protein
MFNRFHNYVVNQLAQINENNRFKKPREGLTEEQTAAVWKKYDNDLFQTGRLITCGLYINVVLVANHCGTQQNKFYLVRAVILLCVIPADMETGRLTQG